jgi:hypothetical protein
MGWQGLGQRQRLCFALALWNGRDPILKERLGLTNAEAITGGRRSTTSTDSTRRIPT